MESHTEGAMFFLLEICTKRKYSRFKEKMLFQNNYTTIFH